MRSLYPGALISLNLYAGGPHRGARFAVLALLSIWGSHSSPASFWLNPLTVSPCCPTIPGAVSSCSARSFWRLPARRRSLPIWDISAESRSGSHRRSRTRSAAWHPHGPLSARAAGIDLDHHRLAGGDFWWVLDLPPSRSARLFAAARGASPLGAGDRTSVRSAYNSGLLVAVVILVLGFRSSDNLEAAYGITVIGMMAITTGLAFLYMRSQGWSLALAAPSFAVFTLVDLTFSAPVCRRLPRTAGFRLLWRRWSLL
jgi:K+ potassium transporter